MSQFPVFVQICFEYIQWLAGHHITWQIVQFFINYHTEAVPSEISSLLFDKYIATRKI